MWRSYSDRTSQAIGIDRDIYGRSDFIGIVHILIRGEKKRRISADYILDALVYDNLETVQHIVDQKVTDIGAHRLLMNQLNAIVEYVKLYYSCHIGLNRDRAHDTKSSLRDGS